MGALLLQWRKGCRFNGKYEGTQFKADVDIMAHHELKVALHGLARDIPVVSEEDLQSQFEQRTHKYWLIDPLDGTAS